MLVAAVAERLADRIPVLADRVSGAQDLSRLLAEGVLPTSRIAAWVLPAGAVGEKPVLGVGSYGQALRQLLSVVLSWRGGDADGRRGVDEVEALLGAMRLALAGFTPVAGRAPLVFEREQLLAAPKGAFVYEQTYSHATALRILP